MAPSCPRCTSAPTTRSKDSTRSAATTIRAAAIRRAICSPKHSPSSKKAPARSSPRAAWRRSRSCSSSCRPAGSCSPRTIATAAPGASSTHGRRKGRFRVIFADLTDPAKLAEALAQKPDLVWIETPSNPLLRITDIRHVAQAAHAIGACCRRRQHVPFAGAAAAARARRRCRRAFDDEVHQRPQRRRRRRGHREGSARRTSSSRGGRTASASPARRSTAILTLRGLRTLAPRMRAHEENAALVAELLDDHPAVSRVFWPGLRASRGPRARRAPAARLRRDAELRARRRRAGDRSVPRRPRIVSRSPNRSAASRASSRIRRR